MGQEYLVEGAKLACIRGNQVVELRIPDGHNYDSGGRKIASCSDCVKNKNIRCFGECSKNEEDGLCKGFMELDKSWMTLGVSQKEGKKVNGKDTLTMDSILICKKGGIIMPLTSGQDFDSEIDMKAFMKRYLKVLQWAMGQNQLCHFFGGDPINLNSGNFVYDRRDLYIHGKLPLAFHRFYNSMSNRQDSPLGEGWKHNYDVKAEFISGKNLINLVLADGREIQYKKEIGGSYRALLGDPEELQELPDGGLLYCSEEAKYYFNHEGRLTQIANEVGTVSLLYGSGGQLQKAISDNGDYLEYLYSSEGRLIRISDHTRRRIELSYSYGLLKSCRTARGFLYTYEYNEARKLQSVITPKGVHAVINEYDGQNRVVKQYMPDGGILECRYDDANRKTYMKERDGTVSTHESDERFRNTRTTDNEHEEEYTYNEQNRIVRHCDKNGNVSLIQYDGRGNRTKVIDGMKNETSMVYDEKNRLVKVCLPNGATIENEYTEDGKLKKVKKPLGDERRIAYNADGLPLKIEHDGDQGINVEYDRKGNITAIIQNGSRAEYRYDELNRVIVSIDGNGNETCFSYNEEDDLVQVINPEGNQMNYEYDEVGKVTAVKGYDGSIIRREYDRCNRVVKQIGKDGGETKVKYDKMGRVKEQELPDGAKTAYTYNRQGKISSITNALGFRTFYEYDGNGNLTKLTNAKNEETIFSYDGCNRLSSRKDPDGLATEYEYNALGQIIKEKYSDGTELAKEYDVAGNLLEETDIFGNVTRYRYDRIGRITGIDGLEAGKAEYEYKDGRLERIQYPDGSEEGFSYDGNGNITLWKRKSGDEITYAYDCMNRVTSICSNEGCVKAFRYDAAGNVSGITDGNGNETKYWYSPYGEIAEVANADGSRMRYEYDQTGRLAAVYRLNGRAREEDSSWKRMYAYEYDLLGQMKNVIDANGNREAYQYDELGRVIAKKDRDGYDTAYTYGKSGMQEEILYGDGRRVQMSYTPLRLLSEVEDWMGRTRFERDEKNRLKEVTDHRGKAVGYEYGEMGECSAVIYPDGSRISYDYNECMALTRISDGKRTIDYRYDRAGRLAGKQFGGGLESGYGYDSAGRLNALVYRDGNRILEECHYSYDMAGNRTEAEKFRSGIPEDSGRFQYEYDVMNRLTGVYRGQELLRGYAYDGCGNRVKKWEGGEETSYFYDGIGRLARESSPAVEKEYSYDGRGNLLAVYCNGSLERSYLFDAANRLAEAGDARSRRKRYFYNGLGYRVGEELEAGGSQRRTEYIVDQTRGYHNLLQEESGESISSYLWDGGLLGMAGRDEPVFFLTDEAGSPLRSVFQTGKTLDWCRWDEYGRGGWEKGACSRFGFTGYMQDEISGTMFAQAREYMPGAGRFISEDWIGGILIFPPSWNRYDYCWGNPLIFIDLTGLMPVWVLEGIQAHTAIKAVAKVAGPIEGGITHTEFYISSGLEGTGKPGEYWTPTGKGRADIVYINNGQAEVYEIKPDSEGGRELGKRQLDRYVEALDNNAEAKEEYRYVNVSKGSSLNKYFNGKVLKDPFIPYVYYHLSIDEAYPGIIFYKREFSMKELARVMGKTMIKLTKDFKEIAETMIKALGYGIMAAAALVVGLVLIANNATVIGIVDDVLAAACLVSAVAYTVLMLGELGICTG